MSLEEYKQNLIAPMGELAVKLRGHALVMIQAALVLIPHYARVMVNK